MEKMLYLNQNVNYNKFFYALPSIDTRMMSFYVKEEFKEEFENTFMNEFKEDVILLKTKEIDKYNLFGNDKLSDNARENLGEYIGIVVNNKYMLCDTINIEDKLNTKGNHSGLTSEETTIPLIVIQVIEMDEHEKLINNIKATMGFEGFILEEKFVCLDESDFNELRDRFGNFVEFIVRDMVSGRGERWKTDQN